MLADFKEVQFSNRNVSDKLGKFDNCKILALLYLLHLIYDLLCNIGNERVV